MDVFETGDVRLRWDAAERIAIMDFKVGAVPSDAEAKACIRQLHAWSGGRAYRVLVDCKNITTADAGWRAAFAEYFRHEGRGVLLAWYNMNLVIRVIVQMFLRATAVRGSGFATEEEARAWLRQAEVAP